MILSGPGCDHFNPLDPITMVATTKHVNKEKSSMNRYYLHRKVKENGGQIKSRRKSIELTEDLFRDPPKKLNKYISVLRTQFNYSTQSVIIYGKRKPELEKRDSLERQAF